jgi:hypothetical protein
VIAAGRGEIRGFIAFTQAQRVIPSIASRSVRLKRAGVNNPIKSGTIDPQFYCLFELGIK